MKAQTNGTKTNGTKSEGSVLFSLMELQRMEEERVRDERTAAQRAREAELARVREQEAAEAQAREEEARRDREEQARLAALQSQVIELHKQTLASGLTEEVERVRRVEEEATATVQRAQAREQAAVARYTSLRKRAQLGVVAASFAILGLLGGSAMSVRSVAGERRTEQAARVQDNAATAARIHELEQHVASDEGRIALLDETARSLQTRNADLARQLDDASRAAPPKTRSAPLVQRVPGARDVPLDGFTSCGPKSEDPMCDHSHVL